MSLLQVSRPKSRTLSPGPWARALPLPSGRVTTWALLLLWACLSAFLALVPHWWLGGWSVRTQDRWFAGASNKAIRLAQTWEHSIGRVPPFTQGDEPELLRYLAREPLTLALVDSTTKRVWMRDGRRLRPATTHEAEVPKEWAAQARASGSFRWIPERPSPEAWGKGASMVAFDHQWCLLKQWNPGSPEVESWLEQNLPAAEGYRFGIVSYRQYRAATELLQKRSGLNVYQPNLSPRVLQVTDLLEAPCREGPSLSRAFGDNWYAVVMMSPDEFRRYSNAYLFRRRMAWLLYGCLVGTSALGLCLFLFSQQRERVHADHLASLAHSLKTPLAILRARCDTVMNEDLERETRRSHLLQIGNDVAQLTRIIEMGLDQSRLRSQVPVGDPIDEAFLEAIDEALTPAFEAKGRQLEVYGVDLAFRAPASSLRTALVTLLENALLHGAGTVELRAIQRKGHFTLSVQDQGSGLSAEVMETLRRGAPQGPPLQGAAPNPGHHLGLLMLAKLARNEGWGLSLENLEPGFRASLEIWI